MNEYGDPKNIDFTDDESSYEFEDSYEYNDDSEPEELDFSHDYDDCY